MKRTSTVRIVRFVVSVGLVLYLLGRINPSQVGSHLKGVKLGFLGLASIMIFLMIAANSIRWKVVLKSKGLDLPLWRLFYFYLVSIFFSSFLPTSIGGDFVRVVGVAHHTGRKSDALASVVIERVLGLSALLPILAVSFPFVLAQVREWKVIVISGLAVILFLAGFLLLLQRSITSRIFLLLTPLLNRFEKLNLRQRLERLYEAMLTYSQHKAEVYVAGILSLTARLLWVGACALVALSIDMKVAFAIFLLVVPVVEIIRMIPISLSGIGLRETAFVVLLRQFGIEGSLSFTMAVVIYLLFFGFGLVGGILYGTKQFFEKGKV
ncbi:MAG: lysylphosphatidylglycerol synthase transmembrane domain-containing protein [bacterium]